MEDGAAKKNKREALINAGIGALGLAAPVVKGAYGIYQAYQADKRIKQLGERPTFKITPEMDKSYKRAERDAKFGYSSEERNAYQQRLERSRSQIFGRGKIIGGGGVAQALNAAVLTNQLGAELDYAASDAQLIRQKRRYADRRGDVISNQRNRITAERINYRNRVEQALGLAGSQGNLNAVEAASEFIPAAGLLGAYLYNPKEKKSLSRKDAGMGKRVAPLLQSRQPNFGYNTPNTEIQRPMFGEGSLYDNRRVKSPVERRF